MFTSLESRFPYLRSSTIGGLKVCLLQFLFLSNFIRLLAVSEDLVWSMTSGVFLELKTSRRNWWSSIITKLWPNGGQCTCDPNQHSDPPVAFG
nr:hypothetical protein Iba_chr08bCG12400 [Ipomoea batatas]GMD25570.1 hypothetical protein Iba_chr08cCG11380 [Ipomoea batatas]GMD28625.1 hypothetical protein Iba_chr08eCG9090 [Ipomoea batatas]